MWALFDWFNNIGIPDTLLVLTFIFLMFIAMVLITKPSFSIGKWHLSFGLSGKGKLPHHNCQYNVDFFHIISKTSEITTKICQLDFIKMTGLQLQYVEQRMVVLKSEIMRVYGLALFKETDCSNVTAQEDYIIFSKLVDTMLREEVLPYLKLSFMTNGFDKMGSMEYQAFVKNKLEYVFQSCNSFMDMWYISNKMIISRVEVKVMMDGMKNFMVDMFFDIYANASGVKKNIEGEKKLLERELNDFVSRLTGKKMPHKLALDD